MKSKSIQPLHPQAYKKLKVIAFEKFNFIRRIEISLICFFTMKLSEPVCMEDRIALF